MEKIFAANDGDLAVGAKTVVESNGSKYIVFKMEDGVYATQSKCPHLGAPLEKGKIVEGGKIQCKFHRAEFDIKTGKACKWANFPPGIQALNFIRGQKDLETYDCVVEDGKIYVNI